MAVAQQAVLEAMLQVGRAERGGVGRGGEGRDGAGIGMKLHAVARCKS